MLDENEPENFVTTPLGPLGKSQQRRAILAERFYDTDSDPPDGPLDVVDFFGKLRSAAIPRKQRRKPTTRYTE